MNKNPIFYQANIRENQGLNEEDSRHCAKVLRMKNHELIDVVDGKGGLFTCEIQQIVGKNVALKILSSIENYQKKEFYLHIGIAPTKNADRLEWFIEKATEIGIDEISLILTEHSERKIQKTERLEKIAIGAMKQSQKAFLPKINELLPLKKVIESVREKQKIIAHFQDGALNLDKVIEPNSSYFVLIGPEGDFSEKEINLVQSADFQVVTLGNSRLRTETAALVATTIINTKHF